MQPRQLVQNWVAAFNRGDASEMAEFYHDDAINHQVTQDPVQGKEAIRKMFAADFSKAEMFCIAGNIFEDGNWSILEWKDPLGLQGCGFFQFREDKIIFQRGYWDKLTFLKMHGLPIE